MQADSEYRPDPDELLSALRKEEQEATKAKLKIFFGMCAGVGKTYDMLKAAHEAKAKGIDVVIGYVETHKRSETDALVVRLPIVPRRQIEYRGTTLEEMDLDALLARKPKLALVDELAHTNAPGSRHAKRYQDVLELLDNGIDVYTTLNVQHLESHTEAVAQITGSVVRETVPDSILDQADEVEVIDIPPDELLKRLAEGKVYTAERSQRAIQNFFRKGNLTALREMSLRLTAERVDHQLREFMQAKRIAGPWKSGQRLFVGISPSPQTVSLIRWARRTAYTMNATWVAVYVETSRQLSDRARAQLEKNIKLARDLGAEILTTADEDVAQGLLRLARQQNATQILLGKPTPLFSIRKSLLDRIIEQSGNLDVYVVGGEQEPGETRRRIRLPQIHSGLLQYGITAGIIGLVALLCYPWSGLLGYQTVSLILLLTVALLPLRFGVGPVLVAAGLSALAWDYLFIPPRFTFAVTQLQDILMLGTYFIIAAVTGVLTARIRARQQAVLRREERATALYSLTKDLSWARTLDEVVKAAVANIRKFFHAEVVVFLSEPDGDIFKDAHPLSSFEVDTKEFGVAAWVYWNEKKAGRFTETLPFAQTSYYPVSGPRYPLAVIGVKPNSGRQFEIDQEILFQNFLSQIASTIEREQLNEMAKRSIASVESERLYKTVFNSISHELRTPIAAIMSASEGLLDVHAGVQTSMQKNLADEIHTASIRLNRLVENLLDMTRLESGRIQPKLDWVDVQDLVGTAVRKLGRELSKHQFVTTIPGDFPLVLMDFTLMEQVLTNLLHNASLYTPEGSRIEVRASLDNNCCLIDVIDDGAGLSADDLLKVFEKFYRVAGTKTGGTGLGLSIARGFVEAHGGTLVASNNSEGGARFTIQLPLKKFDPIKSLQGGHD